jgi:hypothetical protein
MSRFFLCFTLVAAGLYSAPPDKTTEKPAEKKSAFDKPTFEAYVRHLKVFGPQIKVEISDPKPSDMPGFVTVAVHASAGGASADYQYYISKDGQKIVEGNLYDISESIQGRAGQVEDRSAAQLRYARRARGAGGVQRFRMSRL